MWNWFVYLLMRTWTGGRDCCTFQVTLCPLQCDKYCKRRNLTQAGRMCSLCRALYTTKINTNINCDIQIIFIIAPVSMVYLSSRQFSLFLICEWEVPQSRPVKTLRHGCVIHCRLGDFMKYGTKFGHLNATLPFLCSKHVSFAGALNTFVYFPLYRNWCKPYSPVNE